MRNGLRRVESGSLLVTSTYSALSFWWYGRCMIKIPRWKSPLVPSPSQEGWPSWRSVPGYVLGVDCGTQNRKKPFWENTN